MANHHDNGNPENKIARSLLEAYKEMRGAGEDAMTPAARLENLGALRDHPAGMYGPSDHGAVRFSVGSDKDNEKVVLDFGTPVNWMAMDPEQAMHLASHLMKHARRVSKSQLIISIDP